MHLTHATLALAALLSTTVASPGTAQTPGDFSDLGGHKTVEQSLADMNRRNDPCVYLEPGEAAAAIGEALAVPPLRVGGGRPDANGTGCRYIVSGFRYLDVAVFKAGGDWAFELLTGVSAKVDQAAQTPGNLVRTLPIEGEWDEVRTFGGAGLMAIRGDTLVTVKAVGLRPPVEKTAALIGAIYRRLDHPLPIDGAAGVAPALLIEQRRPHPRNVCLLVDRRDLEAIGQPSDATTSTERECSWRLMVDGKPNLVGVTVLWRGGYDQFDMLRTTLQGTDKLAAGLATQMDPAVAALMRNVGRLTDLPPGRWDFAFSSRTGLTAVRRDMLVAAYAPGIPAPKVAALMEHVLLRIETP